jgi:hypothetical protein
MHNGFQIPKFPNGAINKDVMVHFCPSSVDHKGLMPKRPYGANIFFAPHFHPNICLKYFYSIKQLPSLLSIVSHQFPLFFPLPQAKVKT